MRDLIDLDRLHTVLRGCGATAANAERYGAPLLATMQHHVIDTPWRMKHFLAQVLHESTRLRAATENLNYSAKGLRATFPKYFRTDAEAKAYARQPERIANKVYANRIGNGPEASGDGWRFRGRGLIQLTGRANYGTFCDSLQLREWGYDVLANPDLVATDPRLATEAAGWYWANERLNAIADDPRLDERATCLAITKGVNGGTIGFDDRLALTVRVRQLLAA